MTYDEEFEYLFREYYDRMYYRAYSYVGDAETSKDIVSDAFGYVWERYASLRGGNVAAVLFQQVRSRSIDVFRHRKVVERHAALWLYLAERDTGIEDDDERLTRIQGVIDTLPERTRSVLEECYFNGSKYAEAASKFSISTNAVKKHIMKALRALREEFK